MAKKLNLAMLNKRKEDISKNEMSKFKAGNNPQQTERASGETECECLAPFTFADSYEMHKLNPCGCKSIWMVFGLSWGFQE